MEEDMVNETEIFSVQENESMNDVLDELALKAHNGDMVAKERLYLIMESEMKKISAIYGIRYKTIVDSDDVLHEIFEINEKLLIIYSKERGHYLNFFRAVVSQNIFWYIIRTKKYNSKVQTFSLDIETNSKFNEEIFPDPDSLTHQDYAESMDKDKKMAKLKEEVLKMPKRNRDIYMDFLDNKSVKEIARIHHLSESGTYRILNQIKTELHDSVKLSEMVERWKTKRHK